ADPHRGGQREQPHARPRRAAVARLPDGGDGYRRGRAPAGPDGPPGADPYGHPASRDERYRGAQAPARRRRHARDSRHGGHRLGDDAGQADDHGGGIRRVPDEAHQRAAVRGSSPRRAGQPYAVVVTTTARLLVVDDTPQNVLLLADLLTSKG